jgi:hypothetical protein
MHNGYEKKSIQDTIAYLYVCCLGPVQDTWVKAIEDGHFATWPSFIATWPSLMEDNVRNSLPKSYDMVKGHMNEIHQHIRSTQATVTEPTPEHEMVQEDKCSYVFAAITQTGKIYTNLTCRFPTTSLTGKKYTLILFDYDRNNVLFVPMKNRGYKELVSLRNYLTKQGIDYQLAPPYIHHRNNAESAIQTFKNHFIAGICSVDPIFPLKLLDKILPQATRTLNLLRKSHINPRMSAYAQLNGHYYFSRTPMAPPGTRIIAHEKNIPMGLLGPSWP